MLIQRDRHTNISNGYNNYSKTAISIVSTNNHILPGQRDHKLILNPPRIFP
jgi:hypothetical protein